ncbi:type 2 lanthipeptide synthetase LanM [Lactococcus formosensis]|jgi:type 2 lantibiotic biosynthesis protein LanM|uniref:Type 2 lantipeptide synthetase LanM n=1 Tax=Lactococcus formosensis TaxID=1281486 RepID=A0A9Q8Y1D1_9LACT|nr:type 2 lanthipeptide synthetase LanM [Lactococcus formosensis]USJ20248.1 type 2 lantipeptide synthetase LanM [Lactococcus formosensis]
MEKFSFEIETIFIDSASTVEEKVKHYSSEKEGISNYLEEWRSARTLLNDTYFKKMLETEKISLKEFSFALQPIELKAHGNVEWLSKLKNIIDEFDYNTVEFSDGIVIVYQPFLALLKKQLFKTIDELKELTVSENIVQSCVEAAGVELFNIFGKIIAIELELYKQTNSFESKNSTEKFQEFLKKTYTSKDDLVSFYSKYPVAARVATERIYYLINNFKLMFQRLDMDLPKLGEKFHLETLELTEIQLSTGDSHQQGNAVTILVFGNKKVVYKPRNLEISLSFERFITWCSENSNLLDLRFPKGAYREDYSYNEFIEKKNCVDSESVEKFYTRYGYLVAICYLLGINDLHMENIIAEGEYPIIIDIETMFQPQLMFENESVFSKITHHLQLDSVMNSSLLPKNLNIGIKKQVELSALNGKEVKTNSKIFGPTGINTDQFHFEQQEAYFKGGNNIPQNNNDEEVEFQEYRLKILEGFQDFMDFVIERKQDFTQLLDVFRRKKVRVLTKGTEQYAMMLRYASHPNYNSEMKYRERLMMNAWAYPYKDKRIVSSEVRDLIFNDIPIFYAYTDSTDIIDSRNKSYDNYFESSGIQDAIQRIQELDQSKIREQYKIMLLSLGVADYYLNEKTRFTALSTMIRKFDYIKESESIAQGLIRDMVRFKDEVSFVNLATNDEQHWYLEASDGSLYSGLSGVGLLFLNLYQKTGKDVYFSYYKNLLNTAIKHSKNQPYKGAFDGWLSPIYPMLVEYKNFGTLVDEEFLNLTIKKLNEFSDEHVQKFEQFDYISGLAGILRLIEKINNTLENKKVSNQIIKIIEAILKEKITQKDKSLNSAGIAHGLSGIALALASCQEVDKEAIRDLFSKEMSLHIKVEDRHKWCWGIPGMIQARIEVLKYFESQDIEEQLKLLVSKFEKELDDIPLDDTLCHGTGGILKTIEELYKYSSDDKWRLKSQQIYANVKENSLSRGYKIKHLLGSDIKGLFDGRAGVGRSYLSDLPNLMLLNIE